MDRTTFTENLYQLSQGNTLSEEKVFLTQNTQSAVGYGLQAVFKNYKLNGSIFEDGLTGMLSVNEMVA